MPIPQSLIYTNITFHQAKTYMPIPQSLQPISHFTKSYMSIPQSLLHQYQHFARWIPRQSTEHTSPHITYPSIKVVELKVTLPHTSWSTVLLCCSSRLHCPAHADMLCYCVDTALGWYRAAEDAHGAWQTPRLWQAQACQTYLRCGCEFPHISFFCCFMIFKWT
jgi:hypothetical protein